MLFEGAPELDDNEYDDDDCCESKGLRQTQQSKHSSSGTQ